MKRFFARTSSPRASALQPGTQSHPGPQPSLQPKFTVPAVPHPCPHEHLTLLVTPSGLLIRPHIPGLKHPASSHVRIEWGKGGKVEDVDGHAGEDDWTRGLVIYGIVGVLELTFASYILVITSRIEIGCLFSPTHPVYGVKGIAPIPLTHDRATMVINTLIARNASVNAQAQRPSLLIHSSTVDSVLSDSSEESSNTEDEGTATPRVKFADNDQVKVMTPLEQSSFSTTTPGSPEAENSGGSESSTPGSEDSLTIAPIAKTIADRLSFWTRLSKRTDPAMIPTSALSEDEATAQHVDIERTSIESLLEQGDGTSRADVLATIVDVTAPPPTAEAQKSELEDKIVKECVKEFTKGGMYFAYSFDLTRSLQSKQAQIAKSQKQNDLLKSLNVLPETSTPTSPKSKHSKQKSNRLSASSPPSTSPPLSATLNSRPHVLVPDNPPPSPNPNAPSSPIHLDRSPIGDKVDPLVEPYPSLPLWRRVDRQYWWNEWLSKPFVDAGLHPYVLPVMQGHYQITSFPIQREPVLNEAGTSTTADYVVISRRSRDRAGLRYQRRGVDDDAHVANFVESESVLRVEREGFMNVFSYVQVRGSVPLFWTQTGYGLKPPPLLSPERTHEQNVDALRKHFERTVPKYGPHTIVNLAEQQGKEAAITKAYRDCACQLDDTGVAYTEYDFHSETKGMKYENIANLIEREARTFESQGYLWISDSQIMSEQKGVFRVNCIDCLDRTNVVQSAFARYVLNRQLGAVALLNADEGKTEMDAVFNDVWANNGDAISRAYAGTSALKGDFTRTGKRDLGGMLNDGVNSLARMYSSTFSDWFHQAVIDFMLGNRTLSVFSEFLLKLQSTDPRELIRLSKIRAEAIATCVSRVLPEGERLLSGWTLFAPESLSTKMGEKFEEKVLLLTAQALYIISYDYTLDKIKMYTRVPLGDIFTINKGAYIISPLEEASRDPVQNAGFMVSWFNNNQTTRVTSYSLRNSVDPTDTPSTSPVPLTPDANTRPVPITSTSFIRKTIENGFSSLEPPGGSSTLSSSTGSNKGPMLSRILSNAAAPAVDSPTTFAAFKALPVDPTRARRGSSTGYAEPADDLTGAASCKEAVELMVEAIRQACEDMGNARVNLVVDGDVVSLVEAQKVTSVYAKMEYGVKRLLWLGG